MTIALDHVELVVEACHGLAQFVSELIKVGTADIAEFDLLELLLGCPRLGSTPGIGWQMFQVTTGCRVLGQKGFDLSGVRWPTIPDDQQFVPEVLLEILETPHDIGFERASQAACAG